MPGRYLERPVRELNFDKSPVPTTNVRPTPSREYSEEAVIWEDEKEALIDRPEGLQKIGNIVNSSTDSEPGPDDNYDTLTLGSIRVTEAIHVRIASSGSSEQHPSDLSAVSKRCSQPGITTCGERGATEATSLAEAGVAVQAFESRSPPPQSTFLQSTSNDIVEIKRMLKEMQFKLEQMEFPRDGTSTPAHGQCCAPERKGLSTRQLNLFAFAVSWIVCVSGY
nr:unnamed protein product [Spirometra erinaceieuropaei]